ncbi:MAG: CoA transferase [Dehalococcoidia bacterium]
MTTLLQGIRVLDLSERSPSAAVAGMLLAGYGAEVIRVEPPGGDPLRALDAARMWYRGNRSVTIDERAVADGSWRALRDSADVILTTARAEQIKPRTLLDGWDESTGQICCVFTAEPHTLEGVRDFVPAEDLYGEQLEARYGLNYAQEGHREGPIYLGFPLAMYGGAWLITNSILGALYQRARTGEGQTVTTSLLDAIAIMLVHKWYATDRTKEIPLKSGIGRQGLGNWKQIISLFECGDGRWIQFHTGARGSFERALIVLGRPDLVVEETGMEMAAAMADEVWDFLEEVFRTQPAQHWVEVLAEADVPCMPVLPPGEALWLDQLMTNEQIDIPEDGAEAGDRRLGRIAKFQRTPLQVRRGAPEAGEDTEALLRADAKSVVDRLLGTPPEAPGRDRIGPLDGILVIDFGVFAAGPFGPRQLRDMGARVIKIEEIDGDPRRRGTSGGFLQVQRGKESLALNLKTPEGVAVVHELVKRADVVHHNLRRAATLKLGINWEALCAINPRLIYCHSSGYGNDGAWAPLPTFEPLLSAVTGMLNRTGGEGNPPLTYLTHMDYGCGMTSAGIVIAALIERERSGLGQYVEVPEVGIGLLAMADVHGPSIDGLTQTFPLGPTQRGHAPSNGLYPVSDGWIVLGCYGAEEWGRLGTALGVPAAQWPGYAEARAQRLEDSPTTKVIEAALAGHTVESALALLRAHRVAAESPRLITNNEAIRLPILHEFGIMSVTQHAEEGEVWQVAHPARFSRRTRPQLEPGPLIGEHTVGILHEIGWSDDQIEDAHRRRVLNAGPSFVPVPAH